MLPKSLVLARYRQGVVTPYRLEYSKPNLSLVEKLISLFADAINTKRRDVEEEVKQLSLEKRNPKVVQGLADILFKRSEFSFSGDEDPQRVREDIYTVSAGYWRSSSTKKGDLESHKRHILTEVNQATDQHMHHTESWLFGDIPGNQRMMGFKEISPKELIDRYNIEQVQALLAQSSALEIKIYRRDATVFRQIMQMLKFHQLMFDLRESDRDWLHITVDGPASILENSRSYGLEIAYFFPTLLLLNTPWSLKTYVKQNQRSRTCALELSNENNYVGSGREKRVWINQKIEKLIEGFNKKYGETYLAHMDQTIITISKNRYLIPDFCVEDKQNPKNRYMFEWVQYQSEWKWRWMKEVKRELPANYYFALKGRSDTAKKKISQLGIGCLVYISDLTVPKIYTYIQDRK